MRIYWLLSYVPKLLYKKQETDPGDVLLAAWYGLGASQTRFRDPWDKQRN